MPPRPPQSASEVIADLAQRVRLLERQFPIIVPPAATPSTDCNCCFGARVRRTTPVAGVASGSPVIIDFEEACYDTSGFWSIANPSRFTAPFDAICTFGACLHWSAGSNAGTTRSMSFQPNGNLAHRFGVADSGAAAGSSFTHFNAGIDWYLSAGDYVELAAFENDGGPLDLLVSDQFAPHYWVRACPVTLPPIIFHEE